MKLPHFFKYAKDKEDKQVNEINDSTVNMLESIVPNKPIQFKKVVGYVNHKLLMKNKNPNYDLEQNKELIDMFTEINRAKGMMVRYKGFDSDGFNQYMKEELLKIHSNESYISDVLVDYFFRTDSAYKETLWECYGEYMYENLLLNIGNTFCCEKCNKRTERNDVKALSQIYCEPCSLEIKKEKNRLRAEKFRKNNAS